MIQIGDRLFEHRAMRACLRQVLDVASATTCHHKPFDVVLLGDGYQLIDDPTDKVLTHLARQGGVKVWCHHQIVQSCVSGTGSIHAKD